MGNRDELSFGITDVSDFEESIFGDAPINSNDEPTPINSEPNEQIVFDDTFDPLEDEEDNKTIQASTEPVVPAEQPVIETPKEPVEDPTDEYSSEFVEEFGQDLFKLGIFTELEEDKGVKFTTPEQIRERLMKEKSLGLNDMMYKFLSKNHGQEGIDAFESIYIKGVKPEDYFNRSTSIQTFKNIPIEGEDNIENQKIIYREFFKRQGIAEAEIEKDLNREIEYGELEEKVKRYLPSLVKQEEKQLEILEKQAQDKLKQQEAYEDQYKTQVANIIGAKLKNKEFDGIPLTEKDADVLFDYVTAKKWELPSTGELLTDFEKWYLIDLKKPENWEMRLKVALLAQTNLDFSKIKNKAISEEKDAIFNSLANKAKVVKRKDLSTNNDRFLEGLK